MPQISRLSQVYEVNTEPAEQTEIVNGDAR